MGKGITSRSNFIKLSILSIALFVTIFSAQAFVQQSFAGHEEEPPMPDPTDLAEFAITSPEDGGSSNNGGSPDNIQLFTEATMLFQSSSSSGTVKLKIVLGSSSSSTVQLISGEGCVFGENPSCVVNQLFTSLNSPLEEGEYEISALYTSNNPHAVPLMVLDTITHTIDTTAPDAPTIDEVNDQTISGGVFATNDQEPKIDGTTIETGLTVILYSDASGLTNSAIGEDVTFSDWVITANQTLPEGVQTITANATDAAGNTSTDTSFTLTVDITGPTVAFTTGSGPTQSNTISGTATDALTNITSVQLFNQTGGVLTLLDTDSTFSGNNANENWSLMVTTEGPYVLIANATDSVGNIGSTDPTTLSINFDITAPTTTITSIFDGTSNLANNAFTTSTTATVNFSVDDNEPTGSGNDKTSCTKTRDNSNDGSVDATDGPVDCTTGKVYNPLSQGNQTIFLNSTDKAGNMELTAIQSWIVDFTPPSFTVPADVRTNATEGSATNTTSIIPEIVIPSVGAATLSDNIVDPEPTIDNPRQNSYNLGNTTLVWTATDAGGLQTVKEQNVTVASVTIDSIEVDEIANTTPKWDVDELNFTGTVYGYFANEKIVVKWGDGETTEVLESTFDGDANSGATWTAAHNYTAGFSGQTLTANATLVSNPDITISNNRQIEILPHTTTLSIKTIADVEEQDGANPSVPWGFNYLVGFNMTDDDFDAAITPSLTLNGLPLDYTAGTANTTSPLITGTVTDNGDGTADVSETFLALEGEAANIGAKLVNGTFDATAAFKRSSDQTALTISAHHTSINIDDIEDVDTSDAEDPSTPWGYAFDGTFTLDDLNATNAATLAGQLVV